MFPFIKYAAFLLTLVRITCYNNLYTKLEASGLNEAKTKIYQVLSSFNQLKWSIAGKGILVGFAAGLLAVLYRTAT